MPLTLTAAAARLGGQFTARQFVPFCLDFRTMRRKKIMQTMLEDE